MKNETDTQSSVPPPGAHVSPSGAPNLSRDEWFLRAYGHSDRQVSGLSRGLHSLGGWIPGGRIVMAAVLGGALGVGFAATRLFHADSQAAQGTVELVAAAPVDNGTATPAVRPGSHANPAADRSPVPLPASAPSTSPLAARVSGPSSIQTSGFQASSVQASSVQASPAVPPSSSLSSDGTPDEVSRLKARNRRLEAMITILRERKQEPKTAPEPSAYIGQ